MKLFRNFSLLSPSIAAIFLTLFCDGSVFAEEASLKEKLMQSSVTWTDEQNQAHHLSDWKSQPLVVSAFYTECKKTCPMVTLAKLKEIQTTLDAKGIKAEFLLVTLNPETDTPETLLKFKKNQNIDHSNWHFLRATDAETRAFAKTLGFGDYWTMDDHIVHNFKISYFDMPKGQEHALTYQNRAVKTLFE